MKLVQREKEKSGKGGITPELICHLKQSSSLPWSGKQLIGGEGGRGGACGGAHRACPVPVCLCFSPAVIARKSERIDVAGIKN